MMVVAGWPQRADLDDWGRFVIWPLAVLAVGRLAGRGDLAGGQA